MNSIFMQVVFVSKYSHSPVVCLWWSFVKEKFTIHSGTYTWSHDNWPSFETGFNEINVAMKRHLRGDFISKKKGRDLTRSYVKSTYTHRKIHKAKRHQKKSYPTGMVKPVYGIQTFPGTPKVVWSKGFQVNILKTKKSPGKLKHNRYTH